MSFARLGLSVVSAVMRVYCLCVLVVLSGCASKPPVSEGDDLAESVIHEGDTVRLAENSPLRGRIAVTPVVSRAVRRSFETPAEVEADPSHIARVSPPLVGRIVKLFVRFGDTVTLDQQLFSLDSPELVAAQTDFLRARSSLAQSERTLARQRDLVTHGIGAAREVEQAQTDRDLAHSELNRAEIRLRLLGIGADSLGHPLTVNAPIAGRIIEYRVAPGEYRNDLSVPLMTIADLSTIWVTAHVQEKDLGRVRVGEDASATFTAYPQLVLSGKVLFVGDLLDPGTRTTQVRVAFSNQDSKLKPGMFALVTFTESSVPEMVIPSTSVLLRGDSNEVFVETTPWNFVRRKITTGEQHGAEISVLTGLKAGERIVSTNAVLLQ